MLLQQLHYHQAIVGVHYSRGIIWLNVEEHEHQTIMYLRDTVQARELAAQLIACADRIEAAAVQPAETPAETLASA